MDAPVDALHRAFARVILLPLLLLLPLSGCRTDPASQPAGAAASARDPGPTPPALPVAQEAGRGAGREAAPPTPPAQQSRGAAVGLRFVDVTERAGIRFRHNTGAFGASFLPETMGSGAAFIDYDGDGWQDIFFVNGRNWTPSEVGGYARSPVGRAEAAFLMARRPSAFAPSRRQVPPNKPYKRTVGALYRNNRDGTFSDVTQSSGLGIEMYGMGAAVGDYDNDGRPDLCVTSYGRAYLFRNLSAGGRPRFREEALAAGVRDSGWSTCAAFLDYDRDGDLDLFVGRYVRWSPSSDVFVSLTGRRKSYGGPTHYRSDSSRLFRNEGRGLFTDVSSRTGISHQPARAGQEGRELLGKALGVAVCDPNGDGWPDLVVANDMEPNFYFVNRGGRSFEESAVRSGIALSERGQPRSGMGIDAADIDQSGRDSVAIGNFNSQMLGLYHNRGGNTFDDIAPGSEVGRVTNWFLTFGLLLSDLDNDSRPDLLAANGHIDPEVQQFSTAISYAERPLLFLNESRPGLPRFREAGPHAGAPLAEPLVARGLAAADYDLDGDLDVLLTTSGGSPRLWRNDGRRLGRSVRLVLRGARSNRSAIGAKVLARAGQLHIHRTVRSGSSYLSQNELPVTLGIGSALSIESLTVQWPSGAVTRLKGVPADRAVVVQEGQGIVEQKPLPRRSS